MKTAGTPRRESWRVVHEQHQTRSTDDLQSIAERLRAGAGAPRIRRWHRLATWISVLVVILLVAGGGWLVYGTNVFDVRTISVVGATTVGPDAVVEASGISRGASLAHVDLAAASSRLLSTLPPLSSANVSRQWPHTVLITVVERKAVALVGPGYREIDASGVVFRTLPARPAGLPLLVLKTPGPKDPATVAALAVSQALTPALRSQLVRITAATPAQVTLVLTKDRTVFWGDASQSAQKATVATALLGQDGKRYDVSAPSVVTVR
jgi:cell division protein FtsQ